MSFQRHQPCDVGNCQNYLSDMPFERCYPHYPKPQLDCFTLCTRGATDFPLATIPYSDRYSPQKLLSLKRSSPYLAGTSYKTHPPHHPKQHRNPLSRFSTIHTDGQTDSVQNDLRTLYTDDARISWLI